METHLFRQRTRILKNFEVHFELRITVLLWSSSDVTCLLFCRRKKITLQYCLIIFSLYTVLYCSNKWLEMGKTKYNIKWPIQALFCSIVLPLPPPISFPWPCFALYKTKYIFYLFDLPQGTYQFLLSVV